MLNHDQETALKIHNTARAGKHVAALQWDQNLANAATQYAQHLAQIGRLEHSQGSGQGENLYMISSSNTPLQAAAQGWIDESKNYHGEKIGERNFSSYGHYSKFTHYFIVGVC